MKPIFRFSGAASCCIVLVFLFSAPQRLDAQAVVGTISQARVLPLREVLEAQVKDSRFRLGPIHLHPRLTLLGPTYSNNYFGTADNPTSDWSATVAGGVRYIVPIGTRIFIRGEATPNYFWALNTKEARRFGFSNDAALYGFLGGFTVEATGGIDKSTTILNTEDLRPVAHTFSRGRIRAELAALGRFSLIADVGVLRRRYDGAGLEPAESARVMALDSDDLALHGGIHYKVSSSLGFGLSYERSSFRFVNDPSRDSDGIGYILSAQFERRRIALNVLGGLREFRPAGTFDFPVYRGATGAIFVSYELLKNLILEVHTLRTLENSTYQGNPYYVETRFGGALTLVVGRRIDVRGIVDVGTNRYPFPSDSGTGEFVARKDVVRTLSGELSLKVFRSVRLTGGLSQTRYRSNIAGLDRTILGFTTKIDFGGVELIR